jgi:hypothetical protein
MDQKTIYSKTGKGVLEIKNKGGKLSKDLTRVLTLIDGKSTVADLTSKAKLPDADIARSIKQLEEAGYIKEFSNLSGGPMSAPPADTSYVDDLDFTSTLAPGKKIYQSGQTEMRAREEAERKKAELEAKAKRDEEESKKKEATERAAREEAARLAKVEAERKAKEAAALKQRAEAERKAKEQAEEMARTTRDLSRVLEVERRALEEADRKKSADPERKADPRSGEEAQRRREEEERARREQTERRAREEEDRKRREEEQRRREEQERARREEAERKRREEDEARRRREEEERARKEEENRRRREEEDRRRREEEARRQREEEERARKEEERRRKEDEARRREEEERRRREQEAVRESAAPFDLPEIEVPPVQESATDFMAEFERQQETLKKRAEEDARRELEAEQSRLATERAQREEEARLEGERRAHEEAEIRGRMQREEEERRARERRREEEYEKKIQEQEARKKKELEDRQRAEQAKIDSDRKAREDELARKRRATEEADRKRRELDTLKRQGRVRSPIDRFKGVAIGLVAVVGLSLAAVEFMPMGGYLPTLQSRISKHLKEPVTIGSVSMSAVSGFQITLDNVAIGSTQDLKLTKVRLVPSLGSLFTDQKVLREVDIEGAGAAEEVLKRLPAWLESAQADTTVRVSRLTMRDVKIALRDMQLPSIQVEISFSPDGAITRANVATSDRKLSADIVPRSGRADVSITASAWRPPLGPKVEFTDFSARGVATADSLHLAEFDGRLYGGALKGDARIRWDGQWRAEGDFEFARIEVSRLLAAFTPDARTSGEVEGTGRFSMQGSKLISMLDAPRVETTFFVRRGDLDGVDLVRALQAGRQGTQGGSTKFEELSGSLAVANGQYQYRSLKLAAGILNANGYFDVGPDQGVSGRTIVELRSQAQQLRQNLNVTGTLRAVVLRP